KALMPPRVGSAMVPVLRACAVEMRARHADETSIRAMMHVLRRRGTGIIEFSPIRYAFFLTRVNHVATREGVRNRMLAIKVNHRSVGGMMVKSLRLGLMLVLALYLGMALAAQNSSAAP